MKNIAVIFGGKSSEHDISILTAVSLINNLSDITYNVYPIYITKTGELLLNTKFKDVETFKKDKIEGKKVTFLLGSNFLYKRRAFSFKKACKIDFCFIACHGLNGEDGAISGLLNLCNIPYSCADISSCAIAMDKVLTKYVLKGLKIPVVNYAVIKKQNFLKFGEDELSRALEKVAFPIIVKPARLGSSIGIKKCENINELKDALNLAFSLDTEVIIETALENFKEYNIAVMKYKGDTKLSLIEEPLGKDEILSFEDKYLRGEKVKGMESLSRKIPANISESVKNKIKEIATKVYEELNFSGVIRIDFLYTDKIYLNEINSIPGSFANYLWDFSYTTLLDLIMEENINEHKLKQNLTYTFESSVLKMGHNKDALK